MCYLHRDNSSGDLLLDRNLKSALCYDEEKEKKFNNEILQIKFPWILDEDKESV